MKLNYSAKLNDIATILLFCSFIFISSCVMPGAALEQAQISQLPQNEIFPHIKKGIVIFRGISCSTTKSNEIKNNFAIDNSYSADCSAYNFISEKNPDYRIQQFADRARIKTDFKSKYSYYTVPAGRYYFLWRGSAAIPGEDLKKAFYFDALEGKAIYAGDFIYNSATKKIKIIDNYNLAKSQLGSEIKVPIIRKLAEGTKTIN